MCRREDHQEVGRRSQNEQGAGDASGDDLEVAPKIFRKDHGAIAAIIDR